jgi:hypothetical protein
MPSHINVQVFNQFFLTKPLNTHTLKHKLIKNLMTIINNQHFIITSTLKSYNKH